MARVIFRWIGAIGLSASVLAPAADAATNLTINPNIPVRPQIYLNAPPHLDVRSNAFRDLDLSDGCRADVRKKRIKQHRRCRRHDD